MVSLPLSKKHKKHAKWCFDDIVKELLQKNCHIWWWTVIFDDNANRRIWCASGNSALIAFLKLYKQENICFLDFLFSSTLLCSSHIFDYDMILSFSLPIEIEMPTDEH